MSNSFLARNVEPLEMMCSIKRDESSIEYRVCDELCLNFSHGKKRIKGTGKRFV